MTVIQGTGLHRKRLNLSIIALAIAAITTTTFWLASSEGILALPQAPTPTGAAAGGKIATFTALIPSLMTVPQGQGAQKINGVLLGKVTVAAGFAPQLRIDVAWLDPWNAGAVLNNPNAWMTFGLYYPIHTGTCTGSDPVNSVSIADSGTLCVARNTQASGPLTYNGEITLDFQMLSGFIMENALDPSTPTTCGATGSAWCAPSGLALNQNDFYITSSINTPGGVPPGQQSQLTTLNFYLGAHAF
jgi:hypothetical protein